MLDSLTDALSGSPWTYALMFGIVAADAVLPLVPGETAVITSAILAADGDLVIGFVVVLAVLGAMLGDVLSYAIGRHLGRRALRRVGRGERGRRRVDWATDQIRRRGTGIVVVARFVPGGRTATTLAAGTLEMPWRRFIAADAIGCLLWASLFAGLGWFGGTAFRDSTWKPLLAAGGAAVLVAGVAELVRRHVERRDAGRG